MWVFIGSASTFQIDFLWSQNPVEVEDWTTVVSISSSLSDGGLSQKFDTVLTQP